MKHYYQLSSNLYQVGHGETTFSPIIYEQDNIWHFPNGERVFESSLRYIKENPLDLRSSTRSFTYLRSVQ